MKGSKYIYVLLVVVASAAAYLNHKGIVPRNNLLILIVISAIGGSLGGALELYLHRRSMRLRNQGAELAKKEAKQAAKHIVIADGASHRRILYGCCGRRTKYLWMASLCIRQSPGDHGKAGRILLTPVLTEGIGKKRLLVRMEGAL